MESENQDKWQKDVLEKLAFAALTEQRRSRRWGIFFKLFFLFYLFLVLILALSGGSGGVPLGKHTALIDLNGIITSESDASADVLVTGLRNAYKDKNVVGIILRTNSPGGSPVQAAYVYDEILRLKKKHPAIPVYAVVTDVCASACYYIASAADRIYANEMSLVGSIGVLAEGFGFVGLIDKLGIERRLYTAGENKGILDPFSPSRESDVKHMEQLLKEAHEHFITAVREGRGSRLKETPDMFSGLFWSGKRGLELGLIDGFASSGAVARDIIGNEEIVDYTPQEDLLRRLSDRLGATLAQFIGMQSQVHLR